MRPREICLSRTFNTLQSDVCLTFDVAVKQYHPLGAVLSSVSFSGLMSVSQTQTNMVTVEEVEIMLLLRQRSRDRAGEWTALCVDTNHRAECGWRLLLPGSNISVVTRPSSSSPCFVMGASELYTAQHRPNEFQWYCCASIRVPKVQVAKIVYNKNTF